MRIASLNLRAYPNMGRGHVGSLAAVVAPFEPDVLLFQECRRGWTVELSETLSMEVRHSHQAAPARPAADFPPDGCAIAVRRPIEFLSTWRIPDDDFRPEAVDAFVREERPADWTPMPDRLKARFAARALMAQVAVDGRSVTLGSFHATPGVSTVGGHRVHEWKPFFHGAVAAYLSRIEGPFMFGIDANEPLRETPDTVRFHWDDARSGSRKMHALLGLDPSHRGRDLLREWHATNGIGPATESCLDITYEAGPDFQRRFDTIWATPDILMTHFRTVLTEIVIAGGDHAMLVADVDLETSALHVPEVPEAQRANDAGLGSPRVGR